MCEDIPAQNGVIAVGSLLSYFLISSCEGVDSANREDQNMKWKCVRMQITGLGVEEWEWFEFVSIEVKVKSNG